MAASTISLPRTSSAASGLRFCGIMLDPVVQRSGSRTKPNGADIQTMISSARRERCTEQIAVAETNSIRLSRSETESREFRVGPSNPSAAAVMCRSMGKDVPARAPAPSGDSFSRARESRKRPRSRPSIST
jgi:hypothetical protein